MDRLDAAAAAAVVVLLGAAGVVTARREPPPAAPAAAGRAPAPADLAPEVARLRALLEAGSLTQAQAQALALAQRYPHEGEPHMLLGDIHLRRQDLAAALRAYREAVDRNPDYLDRKTPLFQGRKLKHVVDEAQREAVTARAHQKLIHYLLRRLAGGCS
ncbi:MAG TPA: tetratricopeptide repeat protein [Polyangia bacterium]|jgi:tetratricopeptide (TPR) repeat protein